MFQCVSTAWLASASEATISFFHFLLTKQAAECAMWTGLLEPFKFLQNLIITMLDDDL